MRRFGCVFVLALAALGYLGFQFGRRESETPPPVRRLPPAERIWTPDEMAKDPEGYLVWAQRQIDTQVKRRDERLESIRQRRVEFTKKHDQFAGNVQELENVHKRLTQAIARADEEQRWPITVMGRTFDRAKAQAIVQETQRLLDERRPLLKTYQDGLAKLDGTAAKLREDLARLSALKEKLVVDLDAVRVNAGLAELEKLRTTEAEIEHFAKILGSMGQDVAGSQAREPGPVDIDALLK
jgi:DNA repair exonuclease SbcCD ATPase subunit